MERASKLENLVNADTLSKVERIQGEIKFIDELLGHLKYVSTPSAKRE